MRTQSLPVLFGLVVIPALACGGGAAPAATQPLLPTEAPPTAAIEAPTTASPTDTPLPSPAPTPLPQPTPVGGGGQLLIAASATGALEEYEIYTVNPDGSGLTQLTDNADFDGPASWSPDGALIGFPHSNLETCGIYVMNADGSQPRLVTDKDCLSDPVWSPDGSRLAFAAQHASGTGTEIWTVNVDGTALSQVTENSGVFDTAPAWSPDGSRIAFHSRRTGNFEIFVVNADGSGLLQITQEAELNHLLPQWLNNQQVAYLRQLPNEFRLVSVTDLPTSQSVDLLQNAEVSYVDTFAVSPDGARVAGHEGTQIYIGPSDFAGALDVETTISLLVDTYASTSIDWSPDSRAVAATRPDSVAVFDAAGTSLAEIPVPGVFRVDWQPANALAAPPVAATGQPAPTTIAAGGQPPEIDGVVGAGEWDEASPAVTLPHGQLLYWNDDEHLYLLLDLTGDTGNDPQVPDFPYGDYFLLTFDANENGQIDANVDVTYGLLPEYTFGVGYMVEANATTGYAESASSLKVGFGPSPASATPHRLWEFAIALSEILAAPGEEVRLGLTAYSPTPEFFESAPETGALTEFERFVRLTLAG